MSRIRQQHDIFMLSILTDLIETASENQAGTQIAILNPVYQRLGDICYPFWLQNETNFFESCHRSHHGQFAYSISTVIKDKTDSDLVPNRRLESQHNLSSHNHDRNGTRHPRTPRSAARNWPRPGNTMALLLIFVPAAGIPNGDIATTRSVAEQPLGELHGTLRRRPV